VGQQHEDRIAVRVATTTATTMVPQSSGRWGRRCEDRMMARVATTMAGNDHAVASQRERKRGIEGNT